MAPRNPRRKITSALDAFDAFDALEGTSDPLARLEAAKRLREAAEELEAAQIRAARTAGATWVVIGGSYGLTKQGAQQRFRRVDEKAGADLPAAKASKARRGG